MTHTLPYAVVVSPVAHLRARPDHRSELKSQRLHGEVVRVDARRHSWLQTSGWDGYRGWVRSWSLRPVGESAARGWARRASASSSAHTVLVRVAPRTSAPVLIVLPWGARLEATGGSREFARVRLGDGRGGFVRRRELATHAGWSGRANPRAVGETGDAGAAIGLRATRLAGAMCGVPYLWGGTSSWGFDCSGLVQWAYALAGAALPRDARDQIIATRRLAAGESPRAGDLLFFGRQGDVNHVAIVVAPPRFVHAYGRVEVATLRRSGRGARPELRSTCLGLRRPLLFR